MHGASALTSEEIRNLPGYSKRWIALFFICISLLVISIDNTIVNVALPSIARETGATSSDLQWIVDSYVLVFASLLLAMGSLGDRYGRRLALQIGLLVLGVGSLWAASTTDAEQLIYARAFSGIGAALIMPATLSLISATFPAEERQVAFAIWAGVFGAGAALGPVTGGWLLEHYDWNMIFYINLPVVALALLGDQFLVAESRDPFTPPVDLGGAVLSVAGLFALVYGIIEAGVYGWTDDKVLLSFAAATLILSTFVWWENRIEHPMLPLHFFKNRSFSVASVTLGVAMFGMLGAVFFLTQYLQSVLGYTPLEAGIRVVPLALGVMTGSGLSPRLVKLIGTKYTVAIGISLVMGVFWFLATVLEVSTGYTEVGFGFVALGLGLGLTFPPATNSIMQSVPVNKAGIASGMNDTVRELGGALGVAILGSILNDHYREGVSGLGQQLPMIPAERLAAVESGIQAAHIVADFAPVPAATQLITDTANTAFVDGMNAAMWVAMVVMAGALVFVLAFLPNKVQSAEEEPSADEANASARVRSTDTLPSPAIGD